MDPKIHRACTGNNYDLAPGEIYGVRSFNLKAHGRLYSIGYPYIWKPGVNTSACELVPSSGRCDRLRHGCGFWAYHDGSMYPYGNIRGVIKAWGKTTIGTKGFRAEKAEIVAICTRPSRRRLNSKVVLQTYGMLIAFIAVLAGFPLALHSESLTGALITTISLLGAWTLVLLFVTHVDFLVSRPDKSMIAFMRVRYPNITYYTSYKDMLKDYPPSYSLGNVK